ncbi:efflux transporter outer membrane subunit [Massilia sp. NEAU-DD11]|uniref:Efflux transporter outer membrane subunit n=1 Tax=Massilia cellulosiltytica TaxID=2683234 RepID=A0A7X3FWM1_9BURK|nr:efflux transporter outer membrane subunit [Telluria cellulosilytica]MVW59302.1 efflux transporter outer membrane subunit [Telluria cellulosilytica]
MTTIRLLAAAVVAVAATGCAVGPDYRRPDAPVPDRYLGQPTAAQGPAAGLDAWWDGFGDPQLARYVAQALAGNLDLAQAAARVAQARAGLHAADAALLPAGAVNASAARAYQSVETPLGRVAGATPGYERWGNAYDVNAAASWEIDVFGSLRRGREAASADYQASTADFVAARLAVAAQTADIYIGIRGLQARLGIAQRQVATRRDLLAKVTLLHDKGVAPAYQVHQTEGELAQAEAAVPALQAALDAASNALDVMLGTPPGTHRDELGASVSIPAVPAIGAMGSPADLLQRRPDLIAAERRVAAGNARIGMAMAEYYPHVSLGALLGSATTLSAGHLFGANASEGAALLGVRWRLFDFGRIDAQIAQAKGREAESLAAYRLAVLHATEDVENAFSALAHRTQQTAVLVRGEDALDRARAASFAAYQRGAASLIDVLRADDTLLRTADARAQAQADVARAAVAAYKALGGGWTQG